MTKSRVTRSRRRARIVAALVAVLLSAARAEAAFHIVVIDEVLTSYDGDSEVQFVESRPLAGFQVVASASVFAAFDASGNYVEDILVVPGPNLANNASGVHWLIGTEAFRQSSGLMPDFIMPAGILPNG